MIAVSQAHSSELLAVWEAEDGRCEACGRAMDRAWAHLSHSQPAVDVARLVCPDCAAGRPDPLKTADVRPATAASMAEALNTTVEAAAAWLVEGMRAYGVLLRVQERRRQYWLPGVGRFGLTIRADARPQVIGGPLGKLHPHPQIRIQPQARTRGLPRLPLPSATAQADPPVDVRAGNGPIRRRTANTTS